MTITTEVKRAWTSASSTTSGWIWPALGIALTGAFFLAPLPPVAAELAQSTAVPLEGSSIYEGFGELEFQGTAHLVIAKLPPSPSLPPSPIRVSTSLDRVVATNVDTGEVCAAMGSTEAVMADDGGVLEGGFLAFHADYRFAPTDPCGPLGGFRVAYLVTPSPAGELESSATVVATAH